MVASRIFSIALLAGALSSRLSAQQVASPMQPASQPQSPVVQRIPLIVPNCTPLQIALDKEIRVRRVGQEISGRVMQPVYVFDRLLIPVGTVAMGRISEIDPVPGRTRTFSAMNADFTPAHKLALVFDELILPGGRHIDLHANVTPDSGQVLRLATANEHKKKVVKDAIAQKMDQARAQWNNAMQQVQSPSKMHRAVHYAVAQLPAHPQYIDAGALYSAEVTQPIDFGSESIPSSRLTAVGVPPAGSLVHAVLLTPLNSAISVKGSDVEAALSQPLMDHGQLILPEGTHLRGTVLQARPARRMHRNGQLRIVFREIVLPDGAVQRVDTRLQGVQSDAANNAQLDDEGGTKSTDSKTRYLSTGVSVGLGLIGSGGRDDVGDASPIAGGATGFKLIGIVVGIAFRSHTYGILMSAYGGGRSIYNNFLGKGREIVFPKYTMMEIGFGNRTSVPMPDVKSGSSK
jgi:hypothetical protein